MIRRIVASLFSRRAPECQFCRVGHFNECIEARAAMDMDPRVAWTCADGVHGPVAEGLGL